MTSKKMRTLLLITFSLFSSYCMAAPILITGNIWNIMSDFFAPIFFIIFSYFPTIFFVQSYNWKLPFRLYIKVIYLLEGIGLLILFVFMIGGLGMSLGNRSKNDFHYSIFMGYLIVQSVLFAIWCLILVTPLSKYKHFNWPFEIRESPEAPK